MGMSATRVSRRMLRQPQARAVCQAEMNFNEGSVLYLCKSLLSPSGQDNCNLEEQGLEAEQGLEVSTAHSWLQCDSLPGLQPRKS